MGRMWLLVFALLGCRKNATALFTPADKKIEKELTAAIGGEIDLASGLFERTFGESFKRKFIELSPTGRAARIPNSGYWYPQSSGGTNVFGVLDKYDRAFHSGQNKAAAWEASYHSSQSSDWAGHCNGFSAAAIRHKEPVQNVLRNGIVFTPYDIKALLSEIYMSAGFSFTGGTRCEATTGSSAFRDRVAIDRLGACSDINPGIWHLAVTNWIGTKKQSIIFDHNADNQVWNFPLYGYNYSAQEVSSEEAFRRVQPNSTAPWPFNNAAVKFFAVQMQIEYTKEGQTETLNQVYTDPKFYRYILEVDAGGNVIGGEWDVYSQQNHPDFIWIPLEPKRGDGTREMANPNLDPDEVLQMWAESRGLGSPESEPPPYDIIDFDSSWGAFPEFGVTISGVQNGTAVRGARNILKIAPVPNLVAYNTDRLEVLIGGKSYIVPTLNPGSIVEVPINLDPGFTKITFNWKTYGANFMKEVEIYTME